MNSTNKRGIILMNLGSPESTSVKDVRIYLNEFLMDERVLDTPYLWRYLLVKGIITPLRAPKSAHAYEKVWTKDGSPLIALSNQLQALVQANTDDVVEIAMRYGNPSPAAAFDRILQRDPSIKEVILVPLYPHYAMSSYETAVVYAEEIYRKKKYPFELKVIRAFYDDPLYLKAMAENIKPYLAQDYDHLLFSYHGLPERHILKADPTGKHCLKSADCCTTDSVAHKTCYKHQGFATMMDVVKQLDIPANKFSMSFQSRLGRDQWLMPYTVKRLEEMPAEGIKKLLVVCPAFVSDCLETLEEMAIAGRKTFLDAGGESFTLIPCLNTHPLWIQAIGSWMDGIEKGETELLVQ